MSSGKKVVVIGAGAIGVCCAYYLWKRGHEVVVLERAAANDESGCSFGNAGLIVPSHFVPLAAPGLIWQGIKWMFNPYSPFSIEPRLNLDLLSWLWKFHKAANHRKVQQAAVVLRDLSLASRKLFVELSDNEGFEFGLQQQGLLMLCKTEATLREEQELARHGNELGLQAEVLDAEQIQAMEPQMKVDVIGGVYFPQDAHLLPEKFMQQITQFLIQQGVVFHYQTEVKKLNYENQRLSLVETTTGNFSADEFILAAGAFSGQLSKQLPVKLPMQPGKGYNLTIQQPAKALQVPSILCEARVAVTPMADRLRFAGTIHIGGAHIVGLNQKVKPKKVQGMVNSIADYYPDFNPTWVENVEPWVGLRPCSPDGMPYIGRLKKCKNMIVATGHCMLGVSLAAVTGHIVSDLVDQQEPIVSSHLIDADRYSR